jgi:hypothetical protein
MPSKLPWEKLKAAFATAKDPQDVALLAIAGKTKQDAYDDVAMGRAPLPLDPAHPDRALHAAIAKAMTERLGAMPTRALGYGKELAQGLGQLVQGKLNPIGEHGYDPGDIAANEAGIAAAQQTMTPPPVRWAATPAPQPSADPTNWLASYSAGGGGAGR